MPATTSHKVPRQKSSAPKEKTFLDLAEIDDEVWEEGLKIEKENPQGLSMREWMKKMFPA